jgi:hypothetical protein
MHLGFVLVAFFAMVVPARTQASAPRAPVNPIETGAACDAKTDDGPALAAAQKAASDRGIIVTCPLRVASGTTTISAPLRIEGSGALELRPGGAVQIVGAFDAGQQQVFRVNGGTLKFSGRTETVHARWWGVVGDGISDDTDALSRFFAAAIEIGRGDLDRGTYSVREGELGIVMPAGGAGPEIRTSGRVVFKARGVADAPVLRIHGGESAFIRGGSFGPFTVIDESRTPATHRHALSLRSVAGFELPYVEGRGIQGDVVNVPEATVAMNPDLFHVYGVHLGTVWAEQCAGYALKNENGAGFTGCDIRQILSADSAGGFYGGGAGVTVGYLSVAGSRSWAIDSPESHPGSIHRVLVQAAELDGCRFGVRIKNGTWWDLRGVRLVHRFRPSEGVYWPRNAVQLGSDKSTISAGSFGIENVIASGGAKSDLGVVAVDLQNTANFVATRLNVRIRDDARFGFTDAETWGNLAQTADVDVWTGERLLYASPQKNEFQVAAEASSPISATGFGTEQSKVRFVTRVRDGRRLYDPSAGFFTVPVTGTYDFRAGLTVGVPPGSVCSIGLAVARKTTPPQYLCSRRLISNDPQFQFFSIDCSGVSLREGDRVFVTAQVTGGAKTTYQYEPMQANYFAGALHSR